MDDIKLFNYLCSLKKNPTLPLINYFNKKIVGPGIITKKGIDLYYDHINDIYVIDKNIIGGNNNENEILII